MKNFSTAYKLYNLIYEKYRDFDYCKKIFYQKYDKKDWRIYMTSSSIGTLKMDWKVYFIVIVNISKKKVYVFFRNKGGWRYPAKRTIFARRMHSEIDVHLKHYTKYLSIIIKLLNLSAEDMDYHFLGNCMDGHLSAIFLSHHYESIQGSRNINFYGIGMPRSIHTRRVLNVLNPLPVHIQCIFIKSDLRSVNHLPEKTIVLENIKPVRHKNFLQYLKWRFYYGDHDYIQYVYAINQFLKAY